MNNVVIFCQSYVPIENALAIIGRYQDSSCSITLIIIGNRDLLKFFETVNNKVLNNRVNLIYFNLYEREELASSRVVRAINYYFVDELLAADREGRRAKEQKGKFEDPNVEFLERSGENVLDQARSPIEVEVGDYNMPKREWGGYRPPVIKRKVMNYGYKEISNIDWVDCV